jgi:D-serine deaminase-like pyridoxal phosphate-dependent protein
LNLSDIETPALVIDFDQLHHNINHMAQLCREAGVALRPHIKTHKIPEIAKMQREAGATGITCAKLGEAEVMVDAGFEDVLIAFPIVGSEKLRRLNALRERARVIVSLDSIEVARGLASTAMRSREPLEIYVEVDVGLHRTGQVPGLPTAQLVYDVARMHDVRVVGLMAHAGHAYRERKPIQRKLLVRRELEELLDTQRKCAELGVAVETLSVGSTPSVEFEMAERGVNEVRPGTYAFNDTKMIQLGVATEETCSAHVVTTVVSRPSAERFVVDAGSKCLSSDGDGEPGWIRVAGRGDLSMDFLSEEHGVGSIDLARGGHLAIGDRLRLIPSHVCPVFNLFDSVYAVRNELVVETFRVAARGRVR